MYILYILYILYMYILCYIYLLISFVDENKEDVSGDENI